MPFNTHAIIATTASTKDESGVVRVVVRTRVRRTWFVAVAVAATAWMLALPWSGNPSRNAYVLVVAGLFWIAAGAALVVQELRVRRFGCGTLELEVRTRTLRKCAGFPQLPWREVNVPSAAALVIECFVQQLQSRGNQQPMTRTRLVLDPSHDTDGEEYRAWAAHLRGRAWHHPPNPPHGTTLVLPALDDRAVRQIATALAGPLAIDVVDLRAQVFEH